MSKKISVGVIFGGRSSEHTASLESAASVLKYLDQDKFEIVPIGITQTGTWFMQTTPAELQQQCIALTQHAHPSNIDSVSTIADHDDTQTELVLTLPHPLSTVTQKIDVIFPLLH